MLSREQVKEFLPLATQSHQSILFNGENIDATTALFLLIDNDLELRQYIQKIDGKRFIKEPDG